VANILYDKGVRSLSDLGYSKDGKNLSNKNTGQIVPFYKDEKINKDGRAQIGWNAAGKGLTNYYVQPDAQGNPVFTPKWKSNAPGGIGGFLLKAAPAIAGIVGGPGAAALTSAGIGALSGNKIGDILKGAAINAAGSYLGGKVGGIANEAAAGLGSAPANFAAGAANNATRELVSGIVQGKIDIGDLAKAGLVGGVTQSAAGAIRDQLADSSTKLPAGQAGPPAPAQITGVSAIDNVLNNTAPALGGQIAAGIASGQDPLTVLQNAGIGLVGNVAGNVTKDIAGDLTGNTYLDNLLGNVGQGLAQSSVTTALRDLTAPGPSSPSRPPAPAPVTAPAPAPALPPAPPPVLPPAPPPVDSTAVAQAPPVNGFDAKYLALFPMLASMNAAPAPAQPLADIGKQLDLNSLFGWKAAQGGQVPSSDSMQQLLALIRSSGKIS
jgi:cell division septation protein DedD